MSDKRSDTVSRRDFIKNGAAAGVGATAMTGLGAQNAAAAAQAPGFNRGWSGGGIQNSDPIRRIDLKDPNRGVGRS